LISKTIGHRQLLLFSNLAYLLQLLYLWKMSRPRYQCKHKTKSWKIHRKCNCGKKNLYLPKGYGA